MRFLVLLLALFACIPSPAIAVLINSGDGSGNTEAPASDPGFAHVGVRSGLSAVYVGNGWVLTAAHVQPGDVVIEGVTYPYVPNSAVAFTHEGGIFADLHAFRLDPAPSLPLLPIRADSPPGVGADVIMAGSGRNRESGWVKWTGLFGRGWAAGNTLRWGTNHVLHVSQDIQVSGRTTRAFTTHYDRDASEHEAQAVHGDSGGAVFVQGANGWELSGIIFAASVLSGQPEDTTFNDNLTFAVDLSYYRDQIIPIVRPACSNTFDDDLDGLADFPNDAGCASGDDDSEQGPGLACDDGIDGDGDGLVDLADPGCLGPSDPDETDPAFVCDDGVDNDGDGFVDVLDPGCLDRADADETEAGMACDDGSDDDGDGLVDYPSDPGCDDPSDGSEKSAALPCDDGLDNDSDGMVDGFDAGCFVPEDPDELAPGVACDDGLDNDMDGTVDLADAGCIWSLDFSEQSPLIVCDDGSDNDGDALVDLADPSCLLGSAETAAELACDDGLDSDGDGLIDAVDPGCTGPLDPSEHTPGASCDDGVDDDFDGLVDLTDPGCGLSLSGLEGTACDDGRDNDGDGRIDWDGAGVGLPDPGCMSSPTRVGELDPFCGLGFELVFLLPPLSWLHARRRAAARARGTDPTLS